MNWLITGGAGFIGSNCVARLLEDGANAVRVFDNLSVGSREALPGCVERTPDRCEPPAAGGPVELVIGDILDREAIRRAAAGMDVIVHLAANTGVPKSIEDPVVDGTTNVLGTLYALEAARAQGVRRFVFASSGAPVGECTPPIHEEVVPHPVSPYGASKLAGEAYCSCYAKSFGIETVALRFGNVYGPGSGNKTSVVAKFIRRALAGQVLEIYGDGSQTRDFVYVTDLVRAIRAAATTPGVGGEIFQIATSRESTVEEIARIIGRVLSEEGIEVTVKHGRERLGDVKRNFSDISKARTLLGFEPQMSLEEGIRETLRDLASE